MVGVDVLESSELMDLLILDMKADFLIHPCIKIGHLIQKMVLMRGIGFTGTCHLIGSIEIVEKTFSMIRKDMHDILPGYQHFLLVASGLTDLGIEVDPLLEVHHLKITLGIITWNEG